MRKAVVLTHPSLRNLERFFHVFLVHQSEMLLLKENTTRGLIRIEETPRLIPRHFTRGEQSKLQAKVGSVHGVSGPSIVDPWRFVDPSFCHVSQLLSRLVGNIKSPLDTDNDFELSII